MQLDNEVKELRLLKAEYTNTVYDMQDKIRSAPKQIEDYEKTLSNLRKDKEHIDKLPIDSETNRPAFRCEGNTLKKSLLKSCPSVKDTGAF